MFFSPMKRATFCTQTGHNALKRDPNEGCVRLSSAHTERTKAMYHNQPLPIPVRTAQAHGTARDALMMAHATLPAPIPPSTRYNKRA